MVTRSPPPLPGRLADTSGPPFVGRRHELEELERIWAAVERGERQAVFLGGEPGSGKSRIAAEMGRGIQARGGAVMFGAASPDLSYPYEPLVQAIDELLLTTEPGLLDVAIRPETAAELLRLSPHIRRHAPDLPEPAERAVEYRRELFDAYADLLRGLTGRGPVALFLEDLHWSSAPTRLLTAHLVEALNDVPLLVFVTMRTTAPDRSTGLSNTIADLYRISGVTRLDLAGLGVDDIADFLAAQAADPTHLAGTAALLKDQTGGNPLFIREIWREIEHGDGMNALREGALGTPRSVADTVERRLGGLAEADRDVLEHAAVLGVGFEIRDVAAALRTDPVSVLATIDRAAERGLVLPAEEPGRATFTHALIRQALLESMPRARSSTAHQRLAEAVEARVDDAPQVAPLLARLYLGSSLGHEPKARRYLERAAETARRGLAYEEAAQLYERAARLGAAEDPETARLLMAAAASHRLAGDFPEARRLYREVHDHPDPTIALQAAIGFEDASWRPGAVGTEARSLLEAAMGRVPADEGDPLYVRALIALGRSYTFSGDIEQGERLGAEALRLARSIGDRDLIADGLVASVLTVLTRPAIIETKRQEAVELRGSAMRTGDYDRLGQAAAYAGYAAYVAGDHEGWQQGWRDLRLSHEKSAQPFWEWVTGCYEFVDAFVRGEFEQGIETAERIRELGHAFGTDDTDGPYGMQMFMVRRETGQLEAVRALVAKDPIRDDSWRPGLLALYTELRMREQARALLGICLDLSVATRDTAVHPAIVAFTAEAALYLQDIDAVKRLLPIMGIYDGTNMLVGQCVAVLGSANRYLGRMEALLGDLESARAHLSKSLEMDLAIGSRVHQAETLAYLALLLERTGDASAEQHRLQAYELATGLGLKRVLGILEPAESTVTSDGLTEREIEVLRLLAKGASNKRIGDELFISPNTAANHVRSILIKTGSSNRTAAAIYAVERELL